MIEVMSAETPDDEIGTSKAEQSKIRECKEKANIIIQTLIESHTNPDEFLQKIKYINRCHYEDIVEERFITKLCGYPVCGNTLVEIPTQRYHISTTANKVYKITGRKKFCSAHCFKASEYIRSQMLTSYLWLRDQEDVPEFKLLCDK